MVRAPDSGVGLAVVKNTVQVIPASASHLDETMQSIQACISKMRSLGIDQWDEEYPSKEIVLAAIDNQSLYLIEQGGSVVLHRKPGSAFPVSNKGLF